MIGSLFPNKTAVKVIGTIFAIINISFIVIFLIGFYLDMKMTKQERQSLLASQSSIEEGSITSYTREESISEKIPKAVKAAEAEFDNYLVALSLTK